MNVRLDGPFGNEEVAGDLAVGPPRGDQGEDLDLAPCQRLDESLPTAIGVTIAGAAGGLAVECPQEFDDVGPQVVPDEVPVAGDLTEHGAELLALIQEDADEPFEVRQLERPHQQ